MSSDTIINSSSNNNNNIINFSELFEQSSENMVRPNTIVIGIVVDVGDEYVTIDIGLKAEGIINTAEFKDENSNLTVTVGDEVEVYVESIEGSGGRVIISRKRVLKEKDMAEMFRYLQ